MTPCAATKVPDSPAPQRAPRIVIGTAWVSDQLYVTGGIGAESIPKLIENVDIDADLDALRTQLRRRGNRKVAESR